MNKENNNGYFLKYWKNTPLQGLGNNGCNSLGYSRKADLGIGYKDTLITCAGVKPSRLFAGCFVIVRVHAVFPGENFIYAVFA